MKIIPRTRLRATTNKIISPWRPTSLPDHHRLPLVLYHFEEMPYEEIAAKLQISLAKVKVDILRARRALAKSLALSELHAEPLTSQ